MAEQYAERLPVADRKLIEVDCSAARPEVEFGHVTVAGSYRFTVEQVVCVCNALRASGQVNII